MTCQIGPHKRYLIERENKNGKKSLFYLKSVSSFISQAILLKFSENVLYIVRKKRYVGIFIILKNKNL